MSAGLAGELFLHGLGLDPVAAVFLGPVERRIGALDQFVERLAGPVLGDQEETGFNLGVLFSRSPVSAAGGRFPLLVADYDSRLADRLPVQLHWMGNAHRRIEMGS